MPSSAVNLTEAALRISMATLHRERNEAIQRAEAAEKLSAMRLAVLRQYVGHHSSCGQCYTVWSTVAEGVGDA